MSPKRAGSPTQSFFTASRLSIPSISLMCRKSIPRRLSLTASVRRPDCALAPLIPARPNRRVYSDNREPPITALASQMSHIFQKPTFSLLRTWLHDLTAGLGCTWCVFLCLKMVTTNPYSWRLSAHAPRSTLRPTRSPQPAPEVRKTRCADQAPRKDKPISLARPPRR